MLPVCVLHEASPVLHLPPPSSSASACLWRILSRPFLTLSPDVSGFLSGSRRTTGVNLRMRKQASFQQFVASSQQPDRWLLWLPVRSAP